MFRFLLKKIEEFGRKIGLVTIDGVMKVLWFLDRATNFTIRQLVRFFKRFSVLTISVLALIFLGYFLYSGYLNKLAEYILISRFPQSQVVVYYPARTKYLPTPELSARSVLVMEKAKGRVLFEKNSQERLAPASTVKLLTALVVLDLYKPSEELKASKECTEVEGTKAGFPADSKFRVGDLITAMLVGSTGDSACVLASGKVTNGDFVNLMNRKALSIGMNSTHVTNPIGLDEENGNNYSTALDLYKLAVYATGVSEIRGAVSTPMYILNSLKGKYSGIIYNTNRFLWEIPNTVGIKTGTTTGAGEVLIYEYSDGLRDIVIVVMGSTDRFADTKAILDWTLTSYSWK